MERRTRFICIVVAICLIAAIAVILVCWCNSRQTFSWRMYGTWVTDEGPADDALPLNINGTIIEPRGDRYFRIKWACSFGGDFPYGINSAEQGDIGIRQDPWGYFTGITSSFNSSTGFDEPAYFALDLDKEYALFYRKTSDGFFVASADPNVTPADIMAHFEAFIEHQVRT